MTIDPIEAFLTRLQHPLIAGIDLSLDRMLRLLAMLGSPHKRLPPVLHVAGTNGKGSLLAYANSICEIAGKRVHRYTSPHLVEFRERVLVQGKMVENSYLQSVMQHMAGVLQQQPATFFEATTALAFVVFAEKPADILLLETGMGGRLDATNVIEKPRVTAITPIALDHTEYLGTDIASIAAEKAGIMKKGVPCVVGRQSPEAMAVLEAKAKELDAPLIRLGTEFTIEAHNGGIYYRSPQRHVLLAPSLAGDFQYDNAACAIACLDTMEGFSFSDEQVAQGISTTKWPARLQLMAGHRYNAVVPQHALYLDGGHNPQGGQMLANWCKSQTGKEIYLVCGMVKGKDSKTFLAPIAPHVTALYAVTIPGESTTKPASEVEFAAKSVGMEAQIAPSVEIALQTIASRAKTPATICICGSLYLAGKVLAVK
jgi:dihydrofolate synthase / folylpolyglutamate synthase